MNTYQTNPLSLSFSLSFLSCFLYVGFSMPYAEMLACNGGQAKMKMKLPPSQASCSWNEDSIGFFIVKLF
jgi:hypothetical protein